MNSKWMYWLACTLWFVGMASFIGYSTLVHGWSRFIDLVLAGIYAAVATRYGIRAGAIQ